MDYQRSCVRGALLSVALLVVAVLLVGAVAAGFSSRYTRHDYAKCPVRPSPEPGVVEIRACAGVAGIPVIWTSEPDASFVDFGSTGKGETLGLGSFHEADRTIEWRGPVVGGTITPVAAILRYATGPSIGKLNVSRLVIYRVAPGQPSCVIGIVGGQDANNTARSLVDRHAATFVCGKSPRVTGS